MFKSMLKSIPHLKRHLLPALVAAAIVLPLLLPARPALALSNVRITIGCSQLTISVDGAVNALGGSVMVPNDFLAQNVVLGFGSLTLVLPYGKTFPQGTIISYNYGTNGFGSGWLSGPCSDGGNYVGPGIPANFVLQTITCNTPVYATVGGTPVSSGETVLAGQTWYVNPVAVKDAKGKSWTEIFVSSYNDPFISTSCLGGAPAK